MRPILLASSLLAFVNTAAADALVPKFAEETDSAGIASIYEGEWEFMVGGGAAAFDCNGDGKAELFLAGGAAKVKFYRNLSPAGGALKFEAAESGLEMDRVTGAYPIDADGDGEMDVVLLRSGENAIMRGLGGCRFENANADWGFDGGDGWSAAFAATWEHGADWPTIAIGNYIDRKEETSPWGSCTENMLHRPGGGRGFAPPAPLTPSYCPLSMLFTDWNRSGTPSLRVSNDREYYEGGQEQMWHVEPGRPPALYTEAGGWKPLRIWGMGIASRDLDGDDYPDYFLTSMADNKLQTLADANAGGNPKPDFKDIAYARGVTAHRPYMGDDLKPSTAWHAAFEDVNNDGLADLFIAKGNVAEMPDFALKDPNNLLVQQPDGKFREAGGEAGVASTAVSRGAALADFNLDGLMDLAVVNRFAPAQIWRNVSSGAGSFVEIRLDQPGANRAAIGSWVEVRTGQTVQRREITIGGGHAGGAAGWVHFGLGAAKDAEIRVIWPDGTKGEWQAVAANGFYTLAPSMAPQVFKPQ